MKARYLFLLIILITSFILTIFDNRIIETDEESSEETNIPNIRFYEEIEDDPNSHPGMINEPIDEPDLDPISP